MIRSRLALGALVLGGVVLGSCGTDTACTSLVGATFAAEPGPPTTLGLPQPPQVYTPTVTFTADTYSAHAGDTVEDYTYTCTQGTILFGRTTQPRGTYDPATDTLIWGTPPYAQPYHRLP